MPSYDDIYDQQIAVLRDLLEDENLEAGLSDEYVRGAVELIADSFGVPSVELADRKIQVLVDLKNQPFGGAAGAYKRPKRDLKYKRVTLFVPWRVGDVLDPDEWNWWNLLNTTEPVFVASTDDLPYDDALDILQTNGLADDPQDLAYQLVKDDD